MSLVERVLPIYRRHDSFFDGLFSGMAMEMDDFDSEMRRMRSRMFHLVPFNDQDTSAIQMDVQRPIIEEKGQSKMHLKFDVSTFKPDEVKVKVIGGNVLQVNAEHREEGPGSVVHRIYQRQYRLPKGVEAEKIHPELTPDGVLTVEGPAPALSPGERLIPITYKK